MAIQEKRDRGVRFWAVISDETGDTLKEVYSIDTAEETAKSLGVSTKELPGDKVPASRPSPRLEPGRGVPTRNYGPWGTSGAGVSGTSGILDGLDDLAPQPIKAQIVNCTPHPIVVELQDGSRRTFDASGIIPRVSSSTVTLDPIDGIPVSQTILGDVENLPEPVAGTWLIVSAFVQQAAPDRKDLLRPDTGPDCIRDDKGRIVAVRRLTR